MVTNKLKMKNITYMFGYVNIIIRPAEELCKVNNTKELYTLGYI